MEIDSTTVLLTVLRESVSLFVLLVFLFFSYNIINKTLTLFENYAENFLDVMEKIADSIGNTP